MKIDLAEKLWTNIHCKGDQPQGMSLANVSLGVPSRVCSLVGGKVFTNVHSKFQPRGDVFCGFQLWSLACQEGGCASGATRLGLARTKAGYCDQKLTFPISIVRR